MVQYGTVQWGLVWYGVVWCVIVWYGMVRYGVVRYGMIMYGVVQYGMVMYGMEWCCYHRETKDMSTRHARYTSHFLGGSIGGAYSVVLSMSSKFSVFFLIKKNLYNMVCRTQSTVNQLYLLQHISMQSHSCDALH